MGMTVNTANVLGKRRSLLHEARCQNCSLSSLCLPLALELEDMEQFDAIIRRRSPLKKGEPLFRQGSTFDSVFAVRSGSLKQVTTEGSGEDQVTNFYLPSELVGLDGIDEESRSEEHTSELQSRPHLVCRLLLEKKNKIK